MCEASWRATSQAQGSADVCSVGETAWKQDGRTCALGRSRMGRSFSASGGQAGEKVAGASVAVR